MWGDCVGEKCVKYGLIGRGCVECGRGVCGVGVGVGGGGGGVCWRCGGCWRCVGVCFRVLCVFLVGVWCVLCVKEVV